ncbi:hypothetical protein O5O45_18755 [Hahella aquimaris]|uniref:hypothetical protein n=1 Tax=Hahella sp. HNIBRBA332 TaxID=3015983 RepID=UPI00273B88BC|nr:hypothetical protein [Hahella sp. HNIBRBA332]WLQ11771.1 hypothetical protein O5O45_18755 [Hahella sp. HNIBRBA332]
MTKKTIHLSLTLMVDVEDPNSDTAAKMLSGVKDAIAASLNEFGGVKERDWKASTALELDPDTMNCDRCAKCGQWVSVNSIWGGPHIDSLPYSVEIDKELLCNTCAPEPVEWAPAREYMRDGKRIKPSEWFMSEESWGCSEPTLDATNNRDDDSWGNCDYQDNSASW